MQRTSVAVIGLGCRFPGSSNSATQFYNNLRNGKDCITPTPKNRWSVEFYQDDEKSKAGKLVPKRGGYMDDLYEFDNEAFNMSAKEAMNIDPQQRILLEVAHQALEDANFDFRGSTTGVFIGTGASDFTQMATYNPYYVNEYTATGGSLAIHANRLSFYFDLRGPSMSIDSACSASGSALHIAMRCLENGDCDNAIVGGINMLHNHSMTIAFSKLGVLSPDCTCNSFDVSANGYVRSEGCGIVVLKPLDKAIRDGNQIYMTIEAVRCNEDGSQSPSLTMPSAEAQELLIRKTLEQSKIDPKSIFYVEAHATGTPVGDPIEANAIGRVLGVEGRDAPLKLGSVKTNIGHLEFASAMASMIKCALMMKARLLLPTIHYKEPNPKIEFDKHNMSVQTELESFTPQSGKHMMISSFGFGGANCCIILGASPVVANKASNWRLDSKPFIYLTSALSKGALAQRIQQIKDLQADEYSLMVSLNSKVHVTNKYLSYGIGDSIASCKFVDPIKIATQRTPVVFVFSGQGPQNIAMGRQLYKTFPKFKEVIDECDALYVKYGGVSVIKDMGLFGETIGDKNIVHKIEVTLPGLIFMQIGLFELWKHFGVTPDAIIGHSFGEMCAIYASNACSLKDIICVTIARAELMKKLEQGKGTMLAVGCSDQDILNIINEAKLEQIWIAAANSPQSVTVGGIVDSIKKLSAICTEKRIFNRQLNVTNAFHTPLMAPLREQAQATFKEISQVTAMPSISFISTVTGEFWEKPFDYTYFWKNIENVVLFQAAVQSALKKYGDDVLFLEMAPHPVLSTSIKQSGAQQVLHSQHREENQQVSLLQAAAKMVAYGIPVNWSAIIGSTPEVVSLPEYPYQHKTFVYESEHHKELRLPSQFGTLLGMKIIHHQTTFQNFISTKSYDWLKDHVVQQSVIFPAAGYIELIMEAIGEKATEISIKNPLLVPSDSFTCVQTCITNNLVEIFSKREGDSSWTLHAVGVKETSASKAHEKLSIQDIKNRCTVTTLPKEEVYKRFNVMNLDYGHDFQCIESLYQGDEESLGVLSTVHLKDKHKFVVHPAILDCCFQSFLGALQSSAYTYLPTAMKNIEVISKPTNDTLYAYCNLTSITEKDITGEILVLNDEGETVIKVTGFTCTKVANKIIAHKHYYTTVWQAKRLPQQHLQWTCDLSKEIATWQQIIANKHKYSNAIASFVNKLPESINSVDLPLNAKRHLAWCKSFAAQQGKVADCDWEKELATISGFDKESETILRVGKNLEDLITNRDNAVSRIMFSDDLIASLYQTSVTFKPAVDIFVSMFDKLKIEPDRVIRILEVGAGTGTMAKRIFPLLQQYNARVEYYFTDVSASFLMQDKRFKEYSFVQYKVVDISKPLSAQGIDESSLDMVIGFDVVHTSYNLSVAMNNLAKALVPDGLLFMIEPTVMEPYMHFIFGVFREWWHFEDNRSTCCLTVEQWKELIPKFGFKNLKTFELAPGHVHSIILAQKADLIEQAAEVVEPVVYTQGEVIPLLELVQNKLQQKNNAPLIIVTQDAQIECKNPQQAALVGFARVIANENPSWNVRAVDFSSTESDANKKKWINAIAANIKSYEIEMAVRNDEVIVPRMKLVPFEASAAKVEQKPYRLEISDGLLDNLKYHYVSNELTEGKVLVKTMAAALNFKDVMLAMNMLDIKNKCLGMEFAGIVEQSMSSKFKVGDEVYGIADYSLGSQILAKEDLIVKKPANISFAEAASIPIVFLTTYYALIYKANIQPEQRILVHSAAGGVGQATIQIAKWKEAQVFATVSNEGKRKFLREKYGVTMFGDSHSGKWDEQVFQQMPEGVDVVLNSLAGANIEMGIKCLRAGGNFIEIGKRDILENIAIHMRPFLNNLSYLSVHLDLLLESHTKILGRMLVDISKLFEQRILTPFVDKVFPVNKTIEAFKYMQSGKHMGKIIISYENAAPVEIMPSLSLFSPKKTYILSGGLGALGFEIAKWMVVMGARYIVLFSRNASKLSKEHKRGLSELKQKGAHIHVSVTNVVNAQEVENCFTSLSTINFPATIGGIMHLAMVLDDDGIPKQNAARFAKVMEPKIRGANNMVSALQKTVTKKEDVDFILFFSSISSVIGNPEQSNYASSNAFLDAFAHQLTLQGFNAKALNLGAVDDVGICATDYKLRKIMAARGLENSLTVAQVVDYIRVTIQSSYAQCITPFNVKGICDFNAGMRSKMSALVRHEQDDSAGAGDADSSASSIAKKIEKILQLDTPIDVNEKLTVYGVDSLLAVEISSMLGKSFGLKVSQMDILSGITVANLQGMLSQ